jgi:2-polyprenyl-3-methyl-5-hydroxy-6-metoxy-1,4-benzoquinol methylase
MNLPSVHEAPCNNLESRATPACPYCTGASTLFTVAHDGNRHTTSLAFNYYQCDACGLVFMNPIPEDMRPFYQGGYQKIPDTLSELRSIAAQEKYRLDPILKYKTSGKLLEIGPWMGIFSCNAKDAGFDVTAIDIDQDCIDFLNGTVGIKALQSSNPAETLSRMDEQFDVIAIWHSLEHLPTPWLVIQRAAEHLAPGGILLIAIPNIESYEFSVFKEAWRHIDAPRHLHFYPIQSLIAVCQANGLAKLELRTKDQLSKTLSSDTWYTWAKSRLPIKYARGVLSLLAFHFAQSREKKENSGSGMTAVFQLPISN